MVFHLLRYQFKLRRRCVVLPLNSGTRLRVLHPVLRQMIEHQHRVVVLVGLVDEALEALILVHAPVHVARLRWR